MLKMAAEKKVYLTFLEAGSQKIVTVPYHGLPPDREIKDIISIFPGPQVLTTRGEIFVIGINAQNNSNILVQSQLVVEAQPLALVKVVKGRDHVYLLVESEDGLMLATKNDPNQEAIFFPTEFDIIDICEYNKTEVIQFNDPVNDSEIFQFYGKDNEVVRISIPLTTFPEPVHSLDSILTLPYETMYFYGERNVYIYDVSKRKLIPLPPLPCFINRVKIDLFHINAVCADGGYYSLDLNAPRKGWSQTELLDFFREGNTFAYVSNDKLLYSLEFTNLTTGKKDFETDKLERTMLGESLVGKVKRCFLGVKDTSGNDAIFWSV